MKIKNILKKTVTVVTTASVFVLPLVACGGGNNGGGGIDDVELHGEQVTEQEWKDAIDTLINCKNYTEKYVTRRSDVDWEECYFHEEKYDIENNIVYINSKKSEQGAYALEAYFFIYPLDDSDSMPKQIFNVVRGYEVSYSEEWNITTAYYLQDLKQYVTSGGTGVLSYIDRFIYDSNGMRRSDYGYSDAKYDDNDGAYCLESDAYGTLSLYYSERYLYGCHYEASYGGFCVSTKSVCSDFGTTVIDVPSEVITAMEQYIAENSVAA